MPVEPAQFFTEQLERAQSGFAIASTNKNAQLAALNLRQAFRHRLMLGLLTWRQGSNPTSYLASAVQQLNEAHLVVQQWDARFDVGASLPMATSALISVLVAKEPTKATSHSNGLAADVRLDLLLAGGNPDQLLANGALGDLRRSKRTHLAADTYENYLRILASKGEPERLETACRLGEKLFSARSNDPFFSGGHQIEGGGPNNELIVDYRLAAALKLAQATVPSVHAWRW